MTSDGSPLVGSVNAAQEPRGTSVAGPIADPGGVVPPASRGVVLVVVAERPANPRCRPRSDHARHGGSQGRGTASDQLAPGELAVDGRRGRVLVQERARPRTARSTTPGGTASGFVIAADPLDQTERDDDRGEGGSVSLGAGSIPNDPVQGPDASSAGKDQGKPREKEGDVGARVVGGGRPTHREEQGQGDERPSGGRDPAEQAEEGSDPYRQLAEGDEHADQRGDGQQVTQQRVQRARALGPDHLRIDAGRIGPIEEGRIGELLEAGDAEGHAEEGP